MATENYYVCSFSGGKDSTAMLLHMMELGTYPLDEVVYCDTSIEFPDMYEHIRRIQHEVEKRNIKFTILKAEHDFEYYLLKQPIKSRKGNIKKGYSWATSNCRWCTSILKTDLLKKYFKELKRTKNVMTYIGLAYDEQYRLKRKNNQNKNHLHPLIDWKWLEKDCLTYCYEHDYDWGGLYAKFNRTSCWCCPLQSLNDLRILYKEYPQLWSTLSRWDSKSRTSFRITTYSVAMLEARFKLEEERSKRGLTINPYTKEFRMALKNLYESKHLKVKENKLNGNTDKAES